MERYVGFECGKTKADMGKPVCVCLCQFEHWHKIAYQCAKKKKKPCQKNVDEILILLDMRSVLFFDILHIQVMILFGSNWSCPITC